MPTFNNSVTGNDNAIVAVAVDGHGVYGKSVSADGVWGESEQGSGVVGIAKLWHGVYGVTESTTGGAGLYGEHKSSGTGVVGKSVSGVGVWGVSDTYEGMHAETHSTTTAALAAYQTNADSNTAALYVRHMGKRTAAVFDGNIIVTGDVEATGVIRMTGGADFAEDFDIAGTEQVEPGTVMVLDDEGALQVSLHAYDRRVAGVISGAGSYRPGIVLDKQAGPGNRLPVALIGKVFCRVDALYGPIEVGDLLTTSDTPGHAMRAADPLRAFGSVIGKALRPCRDGQQLIPILIALQ